MNRRKFLHALGGATVAALPGVALASSLVPNVAEMPAMDLCEASLMEMLKDLHENASMVVFPRYIVGFSDHRGTFGGTGT